MGFRQQQHKPTREEREKNNETRELRSEYNKLRKEVKRLRKQLRKEAEREPVEPEVSVPEPLQLTKVCSFCGSADLKEAPTWQQNVVLVVCMDCQQKWKETKSE